METCIVGLVNDADERTRIIRISKVAFVGMRARELGVNNR